MSAEYTTLLDEKGLADNCHADYISFTLRTKSLLHQLRRNSLFAPVLVFISVLIAVYLYLHWTSAAYQLQLEDVYAVISIDLNLYYLAHVPFVVQHWKNLGVKTLLMLTLKEGEAVESDEAARRVVAFCEGMGARIIYLHNDTIDAGQFAQTARAFAASTDFAFTLDAEKTVFITTDADFFPFDIWHHVPNRRKGKEIYFYDFDCCGSVFWGKEKYRMYIMITIGMTLRRWRETMGLPSDKPLNSSQIDDNIQSTFNHTIREQNTFWRWFLDQRYFGLKFRHWKIRHPYIYNDIRDFFDREGMNRLERRWWPSADELERSPLNTWESVHATPGVIMDHIWHANLPLYKKLYTAEQLRRLISYREGVVRVMNVTETMRRHYHPEQHDAYWKSAFNQSSMVQKREAVFHGTSVQM